MEGLTSGNQLENDTQNSRTGDILPPDVVRYEDAEKFCLQLISEFLQSYELESTLAAFTMECSDLGYVTPHVTKKERIKKENLLKILKHFADKDLNNFFNAWEMLVPSSIQEKLDYKKLTFYLHIHFAVLPLRKQNETTHDNNLSVLPDSKCGDINVEQTKEEEISAKGNSAAALNHGEQLEMDNPVEKPEAERSRGMDVLRNFLETKGTEFSAEPEFLPYYALPFVSDPASHPSFQELFTESWVSRLTISLRDFVVEHSWGAVVSPRLLQLGLETHCGAVHKSHSQLLEAHKNFKQLKRRYQKLHKDHHNLIGIAAELTGALESSVKGHAVDLKATLNNCTKIFPDLFTRWTGIEQLPEEAPEEVIRRSIAQSRDDHAGSGFDLDFRKIKQHLSSGSVKTKLLLFQALRWRITRSSPEDRDNVVGTYFRHDVLSLHNHGSQPSSSRLGHCDSSAQLPLVTHFNPAHASTPHPLQQVAARLVNTLASLRCGRDYLCSAGCGVLRVLVPCLHGDKGIKMDATTADMVLATLQKLSLRHSQRLGMIEMGLVEWLIKRLNADSITMKAYTLEYSTALLMNLCLHRRAKERCVPLAKTVLKLLTALLGTEIIQAIPYVNGTLYSLLANPQLNHEAKRMGLCGVLEFYLKNSEGEMSKQLEYILKLHRGDCQPDHSSTSDEENADDDTEEVDLLEEELDNDDPVRSLHGELSGDQLLYQQYRLVFPYHGVVHPSSSSTSQSAVDMLLRPTTPRVLSLGSLEGKCPNTSVCTTTRSATSPELCHPHNKEEESSETCSKPFDSLVLESLEKDEGEDEDEDEAVVCNGTSTCDSRTDCKPNDSALLSTTDSCSNKVAEVPPAQPSAASEDG